MEIGGYQGLRVRVGNTCGSGSIVRINRDLGRMWILSNAHVTGTQIGRVVTLEHVTPNGDVSSVRGTIVAAGYRTGQSVDWSVIEAPLTEWATIARPLAAPGTPHERLVTVGCPRCELPSSRRLRLVSDRGPVARATPTAIGGQSGSGIFTDTSTIGLITWTNGRETLYQPADALRRTMNPEWFALPQQTDWDLPPDAIPACDETQPTSDGWHGMLPVGWWDDIAEQMPTTSELWTLIQLLAPIIVEWLRTRTPR